MSVLPRPEAAPAMGNLTFGRLGQFLNYCQGENSSSQEDIGSLVISDHDSLSLWTPDTRFSEAVRHIQAGKVTLNEDILQLRRVKIDSDGKNNSGTDMYPRKSRRQDLMRLRSLRNSGIQVDEDGLDAISWLLHGHSTLSSLYLVNNSILPKSPFAMKRLALGISMSNLRILEINNNKIGPRSIVQLLDNINAPSLTHLTLSMTMLEENLKEDQRTNPLWADSKEEEEIQQSNESSHEVWRREVSRVGDSVVKLVSNRRGTDDGGYAPRLERLSLNGNDLGWKTVKKIVASILECNKSLIEVEFFATTNPGDSEDDDVSTESTHTVRRVTSIGTLYYQNRQANRTNHGQGNATPPRRSTLTPAPRVALTKQNWRGELGRHLWKNRLRRKDVKDASRHILPIARVMTCKSREGNNSPQFAFTRLPPEIRARVYLFLDDKSILSLEQMKRIISFASNPATLGYGCKSANLGLSDMALQQIKKEAQGSSDEDTNDYGLIPHHQWSWKEMMRDFPMPRDWPATILDENMRRAKAGEGEDDHSETEGLGGGGPDGRGGLTYESPGPDAARRRWLEEQSGLHAFWESTGTYREE